MAGIPSPACGQGGDTQQGEAAVTRKVGKQQDKRQRKTVDLTGTPAPTTVPGNPSSNNPTQQQTSTTARPTTTGARKRTKQQDKGQRKTVDLTGTPAPTTVPGNSSSNNPTQQKTSTTAKPTTKRQVASTESQQPKKAKGSRANNNVNNPTWVLKKYAGKRSTVCYGKLPYISSDKRCV